MSEIYYVVESDTNLIAYEFDSNEKAERAIKDFPGQYHIMSSMTSITDDDKWSGIYPAEWENIC